MAHEYTAELLKTLNQIKTLKRCEEMRQKFSTDNTIIVCSQRLEDFAREKFPDYKMYVEADSVLPSSDTMYFCPIVEPMVKIEYLDNVYSFDEICDMYKEERDAKV